MSPLPRSTPSEQQVDAEGVQATLDAWERSGTELHSLMVLRHGSVVAEGWWSPYSAGRRHLLYSLSKTFTATAAALASGEGLLDLDDTLLSHFPELDADVTDPRSRAIRLRHVAAMASGHDHETLPEALAEDPANPVRGFLRLPPQAEPGTLFAYNQPCTFSLGAVVQRRSGRTLTQYLRPLLDRLGAGPVGWLSRDGVELGFSGLHARTEDVARLGQLYLSGGRWEGEQLLPDGWVAEATRSHVATDGEPNPDWRQGYGFQVWQSRHGYRGDGAFGQFCLVLPEQDAVVVTTAATEDMQTLLDAVWEHLLPALGAEGDLDADARLAERLAGLRLRPAGDGGAVEGRWAGHRTVTPGERTPDGLDALELSEGPEGWTLTLHQAGELFTVPLGAGDWAVGDAQGADGPVPVAVSAGPVTTADGTSALAVAVLLLETPHALDLTLHADGQADVAWRTVPLHRGRLAEMRCPV
ncbi:serine hydrolase domain-containing protein [Desertihabitans brevis]|uniref:serine hydrolase domain-containing protein n=1 Tax=Desertihabitans brevis TaxID=2268447 RepID=UPI0018F5D13F|nr:serine hydrolase domain-containing protein [Desertihabitans brevis]